jgi:drug/metabolite transporter (DMT)-like permease
MSVLASLAALAASFSWAAGAILAYTPAARLGVFEFTRTQLVSSSALLLLIVSIAGSWPSISWVHWPNFAASSLIGVVLGNLAMVGCLRRGGPRRTQLLMSLSVPVAMVLGSIILGETISLAKSAGTALVLSGVGLAVMYGRGAVALEPMDGPLRWVIILGFLAALCQAIGLIALKPALLAGTDPLAASALRTGGGALVMTIVGLWPAAAFRPTTKPTGKVVLSAMLPGFLGYVVAVSLLLYAIRIHETGIAAALGSVAPVVMLPMIWLITKQPPALQAWLGACLVILGTGLIVVT